ncbi:DUF2695 domain-containing protein [Desulfitobacterium sp. PCE1]|uniref:DUF2695 domain-containing protein n=1 Tax=Desulfitobacterium sp. PCE1 TaxID=146907 RepID=UPI00035E6073|nr:DUF2695 domain-containing protein [Desulfitobacterium sp. PCE1]
MLWESIREEGQEEQEHPLLKDKKLIKEEVNRRLVHGIKKANLEYDSLYSHEKSSLNKDSELLSQLFHRMFFYRLNEKLSAFHCDHTYRFSRQILTQMQFNRGKINDILEIFKKNGGECDCEVLYNVESLLIGKDA